MQRHNVAERAISTCKNHVLAGLATCPNDFPIQAWDHLLDQCIITLNLLQTSCVNPQLSAYTYIYGNYDFNKCPLAPPGPKVVVHSKPAQCNSWQYHRIDGFYIGPCSNQYRCMKCYIPSTGATVDTDTLEFIPEQIPIPSVNDEEAIKHAASDIVHILARFGHM
eukprot:14126349-Ditylum_brightwellii.AAC.2